MADELTKMMTEQLRDAYSAEKQALRAMPKMMKKAESQGLKQAIQTHIDQTEGQIERLDRALEAVGGKPGRKVCEGMRGIIEEGQSELEDHDKGPMLDALIVAGMQRIEHYEIAAYGTMAALAKACGEDEVARLLAETLEEEKQTDQLLTELAESEINPAMVQEVRGEEMDEEAEEEAPPKPANDRRGSGGGRRRSAA
ncbi:MAG: ferritin-like domain-containing protein [Acetobacteraceae bacterium]|nr:ferritin-like domain-containing protein [Acetobacteraceae bacterium]